MTKSLFKSPIFIGWVVCSIGMLFYCYAYFLRVSPSVMMDDLLRHFRINALQFGTLSALYYYSYTPMQLPVGIILDRYGARVVLLLACLTAVAGLAIFIVANQYLVAGSGRFLIGFGCAFAYIAVLKLATVWLPPNQFAMMAGLTTSMGMIAAIFSDEFLTDFVHQIGYRHALEYALYAGVILAILIAVLVKSAPKGASSEGQQAAKKISYQDLGKTLLGIMRNPQMWLLGAIGCFLYMPASVFLDVWDIPFLERVHHLNPYQAADAAAMVFIGWIIFSPLIGWLSDVIRKRRILLTIGCVGATTTIAFIFYGPSPLPLPTLMVLLCLFGAFCSVHPLVFSLSKENNVPGVTGTATAVTNTLIMLGGVIFQPLVGKILVWHWRGTIAGGVPVYSASDYTVALTILPVVLLIASALTFFLRETHCQNLTLKKSRQLAIHHRL